MDTLTFIERIVASAIWPLTVLAIVLILRRQIVSLLGRLRKLKSKELELELGAEIETIEAARARLGDQAGKLVDREAERYARLLKASPKTVIVESWKRVEKAISQLLMDCGEELDDEDFRHPVRMVERLLSQGHLDADSYALVRGMLVLRNKIVHYEPLRVKTKEARVYYENALVVLKKLGDAGSTLFS
jgi:hypothetical protein